MYHPAKKEALRHAKVFERNIFLGYLCKCCNHLFLFKEVQCDHIVPIGNATPQNEDDFIVSLRKLNCEVDGLQILCKKCHSKKTKQDNFNSQKKGNLKVICDYMQCDDKFVEKHIIDLKHLRRVRNAIDKFYIAPEKEKEKLKKSLKKTIHKYFMINAA